MLNVFFEVRLREISDFCLFVFIVVCVFSYFAPGTCNKLYHKLISSQTTQCGSLIYRILHNSTRVHVVMYIVSFEGLIPAMMLGALKVKSCLFLQEGHTSPTLTFDIFLIF